MLYTVGINYQVDHYNECACVKFEFNKTVVYRK